MKRDWRHWRTFGQAVLAAGGVIALRYFLDRLGWEFIPLGGLHTSIIAGSFFVVGFILSATIADYKESEKLPAEFSATIENMYEDALSISQTYSKFDLDSFRTTLLSILATLQEDVIKVTRETHHQIFALSNIFVEMERAGVPPNFIAKLKVEQGQLTKSLFRIYYIQTIQFIPSAYLFARVLSMAVIGLLLITAIEPAGAGLALTGLITFIFTYLFRLLQIISTPFQKRGTTKDSVSLFLLDRTIEHLRRDSKK